MSALDGADVVVVGPAPPLRGGIAAHTARVVEALRAGGTAAAAASYRRLYPDFAFPGRGQRTAAPRPDWNDEILDVLRPATWMRLRRRLAASDAPVVLQWWHPSVAPALLAATAGIARERLVAICHNVLPHERLPGATLAARRVLGRCGRVVCHSLAEQAVARRVLGARSGTSSDEIVHVPMPCLLSRDALRTHAAAAELAGVPASARVFVAAGHVRGYKGIDVLLEAWGRSRRPPEARLVLVGESYLRGRAARAVAERSAADPSIVLVDRYVEDEDLVCFLRRSEVLLAAHVAASQSGLLPIARALGLPCIVSDAGGLAEQIAADRSEVVRAGDVGAWTGAIERRLALAAPTDRATRAAEAGEEAFLCDWRGVVEAMGFAGRP